MKKIPIIMAAMLCLSSCDRQVSIDPFMSNDGLMDKYELVLLTVTKSGIEEVNLKLGDVEDYTLIATLLKNGEPVSGATFVWNDPETGGYYSGKTQTATSHHSVTAIKEGSGSIITVTGYEDGKARATSQNIEVKVAPAEEIPGPGPTPEPYAVSYTGKIDITSYLDLDHCAPGAGEKVYTTKSSNISDWVNPPVNSDGEDTKLDIKVSGTVYMSDGTSFAVAQSQGIIGTNTGDDSAAFDCWCTIGDVITISIGTPGHEVFTWTVETRRW